MKPLAWARVVYSRQADAVKQHLDAERGRRLRRAIAIIKNGPEGGDVAGYHAEGKMLHQMTAADTHVISQVVFWEIGRRNRIILIEICDWEPLSTGAR